MGSPCCFCRVCKPDCRLCRTCLAWVKWAWEDHLGCCFCRNNPHTDFGMKWAAVEALQHHWGKVNDERKQKYAHMAMFVRSVAATDLTMQCTPGECMNWAAARQKPPLPPGSTPLAPTSRCMPTWPCVQAVGSLSVVLQTSPAAVQCFPGCAAVQAGETTKPARLLPVAATCFSGPACPPWCRQLTCCCAVMLSAALHASLTVWLCRQGRSAFSVAGAPSRCFASFAGTVPFCRH